MNNNRFTLFLLILLSFFYISLNGQGKNIAIDVNKISTSEYYDTDGYSGYSYTCDSVLDFSSATITFKLDRIGYLYFNRYLFFNACTFLRADNLYHCSFMIDSTDFKKNGNVTSNMTEFSRCHFKNDASFSGSTFYTYLKANYSTFNKNAIFRSVNFKFKVSFDSVKFKQNADFNYSVFNDMVSFNNCLFNDTLYLSNIHTNSSATIVFSNAVLPDFIDLSNNPRLETTIDLTTANFTDLSRYNSKTSAYKQHYLFLPNTDITKIKFDYRHFKFSFYNPISHQKVSNKEILKIYELGLKYFESTGQKLDYDLLKAEYEYFKFSTKHWIDRNWYYLTSSPSHAIYFTLIVLLFISFLNIGFYRKLNSDVYNVFNVENISYYKRQQNIRSLGSHIFDSFVYTFVIFFAFYLNLDRLKNKNRPLLFWFFIIYGFGILCISIIAHVIFK